MPGHFGNKNSFTFYWAIQQSSACWIDQYQCAKVIRDFIIIIEYKLSPGINNWGLFCLLFLEIGSYIWQWRRDDVWGTKSLCHILFITSWSWPWKRGSRSYTCVFGWCHIQVWCGSYTSSKCCDTVTWLCVFHNVINVRDTPILHDFFAVQ